jgi:hypothetical protein
MIQFSRAKLGIVSIIPMDLNPIRCRKTNESAKLSEPVSKNEYHRRFKDEENETSF